MVTETSRTKKIAEVAAARAGTTRPKRSSISGLGAAPPDLGANPARPAAWVPLATLLNCRERALSILEAGLMQIRGSAPSSDLRDEVDDLLSRARGAARGSAG